MVLCIVNRIHYFCENGAKKIVGKVNGLGNQKCDGLPSGVCMWTRLVWVLRFLPFAAEVLEEDAEDVDGADFELEDEEDKGCMLVGFA